MAIRNVIEINEDKCNGCAQCVNACIEGAIQMINGKAKLISDVYCDGLGACVGDCPVGALTVVQREAVEFDKKAVSEHLRKSTPTASNRATCSGAIPATPKLSSCPGSMTRSMNIDVTTDPDGARVSQLSNWPVQLHLVSPMAPYFENAALKIVADCVPFAFNGFHERFLKGDPVIIACPKLDDVSPYVEKLTQIMSHNDLRSVTVVHMEVPCCNGLKMMVDQARILSNVKIELRDVVVSINGEVLSDNVV